MKRYFIDMPNLKKEEIHAIDLVLENMEGVTVYHNEIIEVNLEFEDELEVGGSGIERRIKSGYIKLCIDEKTRRYQGDLIIYDEKNRIIKKPHKQKIEGRLLELCNICYINVTYEECHWTEHIDVPYDEEEYGEDDYGNVMERISVCASAKIDEDGNLIILFGESSEFELLNGEAISLEEFAKRWERYTKEELQAICRLYALSFSSTNTQEELIGKLAKYHYNKFMAMQE